MKRFLFLCLVAVCLVAALSGIYNTATASQGAQPQPTPASQVGIVYHVHMTIERGHRIQGPPTISAAYINQELAAHDSPAAGLGGALYTLGVQYGIDPAWALAFFWHESRYGTTGEATVTRSLGNERCIADRPCNAAGFAVFQSWIDGFQHWYSLILNLYIRAWGKATVEAIIPIYAPASAGNSPGDYLRDVLTSVAGYHAGRL